MAPKERASSPVPDDWEDDDSDEGSGGEEHNRRIWEEANTKAPAPMPTIVTSSASSSVIPLPPPAAFQPALRILKRPSPSSSTPSTPSGTSTPDASGNLKEREARYQAARERIFGGDIPTQAAAPPSAVRVIREPRGPSEKQDQGSSEDGKVNKGFAQRRGSKAAPPPTPPVSQ